MFLWAPEHDGGLRSVVVVEFGEVRLCLVHWVSCLLSLHLVSSFCWVKSSLFVEFLSRLCVFSHRSVYVVQRACVVLLGERRRWSRKVFTLCCCGVPLCFFAKAAKFIGGEGHRRHHIGCNRVVSNPGTNVVPMVRTLVGARMCRLRRSFWVSCARCVGSLAPPSVRWCCPLCFFTFVVCPLARGECRHGVVVCVECVAFGLSAAIAGGPSGAALL